MLNNTALPTTASKKPYRSVELFGGAAGLGLGLAQAGYKHELVVEQDHAACEIIRANQAAGNALVAEWQIAEADIKTLDLSDVAPEPDLLAAGPPCQSFSIGGKHRGASDDRNLWPWVVSAVRQLRPRAFVFENVPALMTKHASYFEYLKLALQLPELASPHGDWEADKEYLRVCTQQNIRSVPTYRINAAKLQAADFGTPQKRTRVFLVGIRDDHECSWEVPHPTHSEEALLAAKWISGSYWEEHQLSRPDYDERGLRFIRKHNQRPPPGLFDEVPAPLERHQTTRDAIADLPDPRTDIETFPDHLAAPREARAYKGHTGSRIDDPSLTLRAGVHGVSGGEAMIDYGEGASVRYRHFTKREAARISSFPDDYSWASATWSEALHAIGNAVPVALGRAVGQSLSAALAA